MCYGVLRAAACVDHHTLMYVWHGQTVREDRVGEASAKIVTNEPGELRLGLRSGFRVTPRISKGPARAGYRIMIFGLWPGTVTANLGLWTYERFINRARDFNLKFAGDAQAAGCLMI